MNALGEFLRARREQVSPKDVGIEAGGFRRVSGLRREEVATLAGISADYYLRLEQGRDRNPSTQVLTALARVLQLDETATAHLTRLGGHLPRKAAAPDTEIPESVTELMAGWPHNPAFVWNRFMDVLAANSLATALSPNYRAGTNMLRAVFLDPAERELRRDWETVTEEAVSVLRASVGPDLSHPRVQELVTELSTDDRFRTLWSRHDIQPKRGRTTHLRHPKVGDLSLKSNKLIIAGTAGLMLVVYHAAPGSPDAAKLNALTT